MVMNFEEGVPFDPGFVQHISAIVPNIQYVYGELNKYKNFGQKRNQFKMIFPKIEGLIDNYMGFYAGCIIWAKAIKSLGNKPILNNFCCGGVYDEEETLQEVKFLRKYLNDLPRDVKYYIGKDYQIDPKYFTILDRYEEFLRLNEGFVKTENTENLAIPDGLKAVDDNQKIFDKVEEVIENGKLFELKDFIV